MTTHFASGGRAFALDDDRLCAVTRTPVPLSARQAAILRYFLDAPDRQVSAAEIAGAVWGGDAPEGAVEQAVGALRAALGDDPAAPLFIEAPSQRGYRFVGGVERSATSLPATPVREVIGVLSRAGSPPHAAGLGEALTAARSIGEARGGDETYKEAVAALMRAAASGDRLPPIALETVIDGLGGWVD